MRKKWPTSKGLKTWSCNLNWMKMIHPALNFCSNLTEENIYKTRHRETSERHVQHWTSSYLISSRQKRPLAGFISSTDNRNGTKQTMCKHFILGARELSLTAQRHQDSKQTTLTCHHVIEMPTLFVKMSRTTT